MALEYAAPVDSEEVMVLNYMEDETPLKLWMELSMHNKSPYMFICHRCLKETQDLRCDGCNDCWNEIAKREKKDSLGMTFNDMANGLRKEYKNE